MGPLEMSIGTSYPATLLISWLPKNCCVFFNVLSLFFYWIVDFFIDLWELFMYCEYLWPYILQIILHSLPTYHFSFSFVFLFFSNNEKFNSFMFSNKSFINKLIDSTLQVLLFSHDL